MKKVRCNNSIHIKIFVDGSFNCFNLHDNVYYTDTKRYHSKLQKSNFNILNKQKFGTKLSPLNKKSYFRY